MNYLAERLKYAREFSGLTQAEIHKLTGLKASTLSNIEKGKVKNPNVLTIQAVAKTTGFSVEWLLKEESVYDSTV